MSTNNEYSLKICVIGTYDGIRTDFIHTFLGVNFQPSVLGVDIHTIRIVVDDQPIKLIIVSPNTAQFYRRNRPSYVRGASACIIFFDKDNRQSFEDVPKWYKEFKKTIPKPIPIALVGFIVDEEEITYDEGSAQAYELDLTYFECNPTDKEEATKIFEFLAAKAIDRGQLKV